MNRNGFLVLAGFCLAASASAHIDIEFDELPGGNYLAGSPILGPSQLSTHYLPIYGVTFGSTAGYVAVVNQEGRANSAPNGITGSTADGKVSYTQANSITASFWDPSNPTVAAGTNFVALQGDRDSSGNHNWPLTLNAYDLEGNLVATDTHPDHNGTTLIVVSSTYNIHRIEFLGSLTEQDGVAVDNFQFNEVTPVPEPTTLAVLGIGSFLIARRRRRAIRRR